MRAENVVEIITANLLRAFPTANNEALARAAELLIIWGAEGAAENLNVELSERLIRDVAAVLSLRPEDMERVGREPGSVAEYRTWSRSEYLPDSDNLPFFPRPPDEPRGGHRRRGPGGAA